MTKLSELFTWYRVTMTKWLKSTGNTRNIERGNKQWNNTQIYFYRLSSIILVNVQCTMYNWEHLRCQTCVRQIFISYAIFEYIYHKCRKWHRIAVFEVSWISASELELCATEMLLNWLYFNIFVNKSHKKSNFIFNPAHQITIKPDRCPIILQFTALTLFN